MPCLGFSKVFDVFTVVINAVHLLVAEFDVILAALLVARLLLPFFHRGLLAFLHGRLLAFLLLALLFGGLLLGVGLRGLWLLLLRRLLRQLLS